MFIISKQILYTHEWKIRIVLDWNQKFVPHTPPTQTGIPCVQVGQDPQFVIFLPSLDLTFVVRQTLNLSNQYAKFLFKLSLSLQRFSRGVYYWLLQCFLLLFMIFCSVCDFPSGDYVIDPGMNWTRSRWETVRYFVD